MILSMIFAILIIGDSTHHKETEARLQKIPCSPCYCTTTTDGDIHADCSNKHLHNIPSSLPTNVTHLIMTNNLLTKPDLHRLSHIKHLDLSKNNISSLNDSLKGVVTLLSLNLHGNQLTLEKATYPKGTFKDLEKLEILDISRNVLVTNSLYPDDSFRDLVSLQTLVVDGLENCTFGQGFARLKNLTTLNISGQRGYCSINRLLNESFLHTPHLRNLDISKCKITDIDVGSFLPLRNIDTLDMSENDQLGFKTFGDSMYGLVNSSLRELMLNQITSSFDIGVQIRRTHFRFFTEIHVKELYLDCNRIEYIEDTVLGVLPSVEIISLKNNDLQVGAYLFASDQLVSLRKLYINNPYTTIGPLPGIVVTNGSCVDREHDLNKVFSLYTTTNTDMSTVQRRQRRSSVYGKDETVKRKNVFHINYNGGVNEVELSQLQSKRLSSDPNRISKQHKKDEIHYSMSVTIPIAPNATFVNASHRDIKGIIGNILFGPNKLQTLDLSFNMLTKWVGPVQQAQNLKFLDLSNNFCKSIASTFLEHASGLQILNISANYLAQSVESDTEGEIFMNQHNVETFRISSNLIRHLPSSIFASMGKLKVLDLSWNMMSSWAVNIHQMKHLCMLDLSYNRFETVPVRLRNQIDAIMKERKDKFHIRMKGNNLKCTCDTLDDLWWMLKPYVAIDDASDTICSLSDGTETSLDKLNNLVLDLQERCKTVIPVIFGAATGLILFLSVVVGGVIYRYRWKLRYLYYTTRRKYRGYQRQMGEEEHFIYDAFVSYAEEEKEFVVQDMQNILEKRFGLRLCIHQRDFMVGEPITANVVNAIQSSRKTIILLTPSFLQSSWCEYEVHMAKFESIHSGRDIFCVVWLIDVPDTRRISRDVLDEIEHGTYIKYPADEVDREEFWQKIKIRRTHVRFFAEIHVKEIYLDCNRIEKIEDTVLNVLPSVEVISLKNNHLQLGAYSFATDQLNQIDAIMKERKDKFHIRMKGTNLKCTCDTLGDLEWMLKQYIAIDDASDTKCSLSDGTETSLDKLNNLVLDLQERCKTVIPVIFGAAAGLILFLSVVVGGVIYRYRWKLRYLYYTTRRKYRGYQKQIDEEEHFIYDAFVSYAEEDREFVVQDMQNILEKRFGLRLCIHQRDFMVGEPITANVVNAIQSSRKTIILLTPSFLESSWCEYEVHMAKFESIHSGRDIFCVVWLIDVPDTRRISRDILDEIEHGTYIKYPADEVDREEFWQKIKAAITF
ncbi:toll-like receptor 4 [Haliotis rubra]|uniref:toll-like receptor 4 n=1 Tax=Haliotis rubra TaxID=36100 RepID=UPI001EE61F11|nr:toll-like receptor 4 [Haliotis rubra]